MTQKQKASIVFYDAQTQQIKICTVLRSQVQSAIDRAAAMTVPPEAEENSTEPVTDEHARQLGGMAILIQAMSNPDLRERLQITTAHPMRWETPTPPVAD
ncbi:hypothetical protein [Paraburkholderia susongensis]|uniref:hypothetical protein n=1 Tax=Paraburkholderia susongensis TaxID=1515439 RepID=UPI000A1CB3E1|nr:hypothetical protein [Paraburkholderia susongensis]